MLVRPSTSAPLARLRTSGGVCANIDASGSWNGNDLLAACARLDGDRPLLVTHVYYKANDPRLNPATWRVVVTRSNGVTLLDGRPKRGELRAPPYCIYGVC